MAMMTDREKLIELLVQAEHAMDGICQNHRCESCPATDKTYCAEELIADHLIANGVTFATDTNVGSKWISVEDRLPKESDADAVGRVWAKLRGEQPRVWHWTLVVDYPEDFTHWMPLPEPPKEN